IYSRAQPRGVRKDILAATAPLCSPSHLFPSAFSQPDSPTHLQLPSKRPSKRRRPVTILYYPLVSLDRIPEHTPTKASPPFLSALPSFSGAYRAGNY
ncbi:hypothetical protein B0H67DRAFT_510488, partial [Lasiosphaeris hirsuta]